jgi:hypothetical protein
MTRPWTRSPQKKTPRRVIHDGALHDEADQIFVTF